MWSGPPASFSERQRPTPAPASIAGVMASRTRESGARPWVQSRRPPHPTHDTTSWSLWSSSEYCRLTPIGCWLGARPGDPERCCCLGWMRRRRGGDDVRGGRTWHSTTRQFRTRKGFRSGMPAETCRQGLRENWPAKDRWPAGPLVEAERRRWPSPLRIPRDLWFEAAAAAETIARLARSLRCRKTGSRRQWNC